MSDLTAYIAGFTTGATALAFRLVASGFEVIHRSDVEPVDPELGRRLARVLDEETADVPYKEPPVPFVDKRAGGLW